MNNSSTDQIKSLENSVPKNSRFWYWFWGITLVLAACMLTSVGAQFRNIPLRISEETTYVTSPLSPDGKSVDFLAAFEQVAYSDKITSAENGYRLLIENFGSEMIRNPTALNSIRRKIGLDMQAATNAPTYRDPYSFLNEWIRGPGFDEKVIRRLISRFNEDQQIPETIDESISQDFIGQRWATRWTLDELPMMERWLVENEEAFGIIAIAVRQKVFECPIRNREDGQTLQSILLGEIQWCRSVARGLMVRINYRIGVNDIDGAIDDFETCKLLGRHLQNQCLSMHFFVGLSIESVADRCAIFGSNGETGTSKQLLRLQKIEQSVPVKTRTDLFTFFERLMYLDTIYSASTNNDFDLLTNEQDKRMLKWGIDWNLVASNFNKNFNVGPTADASRIEEASFRDYLSRTRRSRRLGRLLAETGTDRDFIRELMNETQCGRQIRKIVLAMLLYEKDHGTLPPAFTVDSSGKQLHSWRVLLLPYLDQEELFGQIHLEEPWDSPHNKRFTSTDVPAFRCEGDLKAKAGDTHYSVVVGPDLAFTGATGTSLDSFPGNDKRLILVGERNEPICWMDPSGEISLSSAKLGVNPSFPPGVKKGTAVIGSHHPQGAIFGFRSGVVEVLLNSVTPDDLIEMLKGKYRRRVE